jgi:hypothetical protein
LSEKSIVGGIPLQAGCKKYLVDESETFPNYHHKGVVRESLEGDLSHKNAKATQKRKKTGK